MAEPGFTINHLMSTTQVFAYGEFLAVLESELNSDRLKKIHYADITRVFCGRVNMPLRIVGSLVILAFGVYLLYASGVFPARNPYLWREPALYFGIAAALFGGVTLALNAIRKKTVILVEAAGRKTKFVKVRMSAAKRDAFIAALLENVGRDQHRAPSLTPLSAADTSARPAAGYGDEDAEPVAVESVVVPLAEQ